MRLVYCVGKLDQPGGTEKVLANKVNYLVEKYAYEIHIITVDNDDFKLFYSYDPRIKFHNISYQKYNKNKSLFPINFYKNVNYFRKEYSKLFNSINPDIITINERGYLDFVIPFINKEIPKIREFHSSKKAIKIHASMMKPFIKKIKHNLMYWVLYKLFEKYNYIVLLTENDKKDSRYNTNITVIPNMHSPVVDKIGSLNNKQVISVGSMNGNIKRFDLQIKVWKKIVKIYPDWVLNIYGDGSQKNKLQRLINNLNLKNNVLLHGKSKELHQHYLENSFFIFTSSGEGFGMVLIEAMSYGLPCISFDCPHGPAEIIKNNIDGLLIKNNDTESLEKGIIKFIKEPQLRKEMGKVSYQNSKRFNPEKVSEKWHELYKKINNENN